ncbi:MAG: hypothetical protein AAFQ60_15890 [Pseudomonadota bacterium]
MIRKRPPAPTWHGLFWRSAQSFRRAENIAALELYHFALGQMPDAAIAHHKHRAALVSRIIGGQKFTVSVLDALRGFTDPNLLLATEGPDTRQRIENLCLLIEESLRD